MSSTSDGLSEMEIGEEDTTWSEARSKKEKRKAKRRKTKEFNQEEMNKIIIGPSTTNTKTTQISGTQKEIISKNIQSNKNQPTKHTNYSPIMDEIKKQITITFFTLIQKLITKGLVSLIIGEKYTQTLKTQY